MPRCELEHHPIAHKRIPLVDPNNRNNFDIVSLSKNLNFQFQNLTRNGMSNNHLQPDYVRVVETSRLTIQWHYLGEQPLGITQGILVSLAIMTVLILVNRKYLLRIRRFCH